MLGGGHLNPRDCRAEGKVWGVFLCDDLGRGERLVDACRKKDEAYHRRDELRRGSTDHRRGYVVRRLRKGG